MQENRLLMQAQHFEDARKVSLISAEVCASAGAVSRVSPLARGAFAPIASPATAATTSAVRLPMSCCLPVASDPKTLRK
jgi:hypothetical protein